MGDAPHDYAYALSWLHDVVKRLERFWLAQDLLSIEATNELHNIIAQANLLCRCIFVSFGCHALYKTMIHCFENVNQWSLPLNLQIEAIPLGSDPLLHLKKMHQVWGEVVVSSVFAFTVATCSSSFDTHVRSIPCVELCFSSQQWIVSLGRPYRENQIFVVFVEKAAAVLTAR